MVVKRQRLGLRRKGMSHPAIVGSTAWTSDKCKVTARYTKNQPDSKDAEYGRTPLSWAAENGHEAVVKLLIAEKAVDPNPKDINGWTPLLWASQYGQETILQLLLNQEVNVDTEDKYGLTALLLAFFDFQNEAEKLLVENGASIPQDFYGLKQLYGCEEAG
ncbi:hypothetical protein DL771_003858 [Monosporascus sp. 5C6A]|nr:hypothetical protein DL771_003858 [Monosporascus sp. 5C6A]